MVDQLTTSADSNVHSSQDWKAKNDDAAFPLLIQLTMNNKANSSIHNSEVDLINLTVPPSTNHTNVKRCTSAPPPIDTSLNDHLERDHLGNPPMRYSNSTGDICSEYTDMKQNHYSIPTITRTSSSGVIASTGSCSDNTLKLIDQDQQDTSSSNTASLRSLQHRDTGLGSFEGMVDDDNSTSQCLLMRSSDFSVHQLASDVSADDFFIKPHQHLECSSHLRRRASAKVPKPIHRQNSIEDARCRYKSFITLS